MHHKLFIALASHFLALCLFHFNYFFVMDKLKVFRSHFSVSCIDLCEWFSWIPRSFVQWGRGTRSTLESQIERLNEGRLCHVGFESPTQPYWLGFFELRPCPNPFFPFLWHCQTTDKKTLAYSEGHSSSLIKVHWETPKVTVSSSNVSSSKHTWKKQLARKLWIQPTGWVYHWPYVIGCYGGLILLREVPHVCDSQNNF